MLVPVESCLEIMSYTPIFYGFITKERVRVNARKVRMSDLIQDFEARLGSLFESLEIRGDRLTLEFCFHL